MNFENIVCQKSQKKRPYILLFCLHAVSRTGQSTETESRLVVGRGRGEGKEEVTAKGYGWSSFRGWHRYSGISGDWNIKRVNFIVCKCKFYLSKKMFIEHLIPTWLTFLGTDSQCPCWLPRVLRNVCFTLKVGVFFFSFLVNPQPRIIFSLTF